jgi:hypothetical protein
MFYSTGSFWQNLQMIGLKLKADRVELKTDSVSVSVGFIKADILLNFRVFNDVQIIEQTVSHIDIPTLINIDFTEASQVEYESNYQQSKFYLYDSECDVFSVHECIQVSVYSALLPDMNRFDYIGFVDLTADDIKSIKTSAGYWLQFASDRILSNNDKWVFIQCCESELDAPFTIQKKSFSVLPPGKYSLYHDNHLIIFERDLVYYIIETAVCGFNYNQVISLLESKHFRALPRIESIPGGFPIDRLVGATGYLMNRMIKIHSGDSFWLYALNPNNVNPESRTNARTFNGINIE